MTEHRADLAAWLPGEWLIDRTINAGAGTFRGRASITAAPDDGLEWREHGHLRLGAHAGPAHRTLLLSRLPDAAWQVSFADGRPFHELDLRGGRAASTHLCGADVYHGVYEVEDDDRFTVSWRVAGPRKDDLIVSRYARRR